METSLDNENSETIECYSTSSILRRAKKRAKSESVSTITLALLNTRLGKTKAKHFKDLRVLLDSGCSGTMVNKNFLKKLRTKSAKEQSWTTKSGTFTTSGKCKVSFSFPEFDANREIEWDVHVDQSDSSQSTYDMIVGRDLLEALGIDLLFSEKMMNWDGATVPMRNVKMFSPENRADLMEEIYLAHDVITTEAERNPKTY